MPRPDPNPAILFLTAATGGGHRAAAAAVAAAVTGGPGARIRTVSLDPLTGPDAHWLVRRVCGWYGPMTRGAPWMWSVAYHLTDVPVVARLLGRLMTRLVEPRIRVALARHRPAVLVCLHPLLVAPARAARDGTGSERTTPRPYLVTVVTDLAVGHRTWWHTGVDRTIVGSAPLRAAALRAGAGNVHPDVIGIPVRLPGPGAPPAPGARRRPGRFTVLVTSGAEGGRGLGSWARALLEHAPEVDVIAACGRNAALKAELDGPAATSGGRLRVLGLVDDLTGWFREVDLVISKAGPNIIAEATAAGVPLLLPTHLPGQEAGNTDLAVAAGVARRIRGRRHLVRTVDDLRLDPTAMADMRRAAVRFARPRAAARIADLLTEQVRPAPPDIGPRAGLRHTEPSTRATGAAR